MKYDNEKISALETIYWSALCTVGAKLQHLLGDRVKARYSSSAIKVKELDLPIKTTRVYMNLKRAS